MLIKKLYDILRWSKGRRYDLLIYRVIKLLLNLMYPVFVRLAPPPKVRDTREDVIVSLTSFPGRIKSVWLTIESLTRQTCKPSKIILWLAESQFDSLEVLPKKLLRLQKKGLEIRFCEDIRSHKKYYFSMKAYPKHTIITVDDDTLYPENLVEALVRTSDKNPGVVCCNLAHWMSVKDGEINGYNEWGSGAQGCGEASHLLVPIGCEGVLYPPGTLSSEAFNIPTIRALCPLADDLWLKAMSTLNGCKAIKVSPISITYVNLLSSGIESLNKMNVDEHMNDVQLMAIMNKYPKVRELWVKGGGHR